MKGHAVPSKTNQKSNGTSDLSPSAKEDAIAIAPPSYGLDFVDRRLPDFPAPGRTGPLDGQRVVQCMFSVKGQSFQNPSNHQFTLTSALNATQPIPRGEARQETGRGAGTGVAVGDIGSYGFVQYLEQTGDGLTGDHQPSGAAVKECIREMLHMALNKPLTRSMARNAYQKAITIVMTDVWHKLSSRTYGGRNTKAQIMQDAANLMSAAIADWRPTVDGLMAAGLSLAEIQGAWDDLCAARTQFFATGDAQAGTL